MTRFSCMKAVYEYTRYLRSRKKYRYLTRKPATWKKKYSKATTWIRPDSLRCRDETGPLSSYIKKVLARAIMLHLSRQTYV